MPSEQREAAKEKSPAQSARPEAAEA